MAARYGMFWIVIIGFLAGLHGFQLQDRVVRQSRIFPDTERDVVTSWKNDYLMNLLDGFPQAITAIDLAERFLRDKPEVIDVIERALANEKGDGYHVSGTVVGALRQLAEDEDSERCARCKSFLGAVEALADNDVPFKMVAAVLIKACEALVPSLGFSTEICPGTMLLQGSHLYAILNVSTAAEVCETLNSCFPDAANPSISVASRVPWRQSRRQAWRVRGDDAIRRRSSDRSRNNTFTIAQMTDIHIQPLYAEGSATECDLPVCCRDDYTGEGSARKYGEYMCNIPEKTMHLFLDRVAELEPDFIIYSGDTPPHTFWDETLDSQLNCSSILMKALHEKLHGRTVYPSIGNHEMYPTNMFYSLLPASQNITSAYAESWKGFANLDLENELTASTLAYFSRNHSADLKIISLNTLQEWYVYNFYGTLHKDAEETVEYKQAIEGALREAQAAGQKVVIIGHHPSGGDCMVRTSRWWQDLMTQYGDVITLHVAGHTHDDSFRLFSDPDTGEAKSVIYVTPCVTSNSYVNPSLRLFHLDPVTYQLLDYENYYFDVSVAGNEAPDIVLNYVATEEYGLLDLSPASWQDLLLRFVEDDELFQKWYHNYHTKTLPEDDFCDTACKQRHLCIMWFSNYDEILECQELIGAEATTTDWASPLQTTEPVDTSAGSRLCVQSLGWLMLLPIVISGL